ncbi:hypothetical protein KC359_g168 [Hortaea werneckii]|nr:hypothetical protein KC359_g168 [Hortaea werneckii]
MSPSLPLASNSSPGCQATHLTSPSCSCKTATVSKLSSSSSSQIHTLLSLLHVASNGAVGANARLLISESCPSNMTANLHSSSWSSSSSPPASPPVKSISAGLPWPPPSSHRRQIPALASKLPVARTLSPLLFGFQAQLRIERLCPPEMVDCC